MPRTPAVPSHRIPRRRPLAAGWLWLLAGLISPTLAAAQAEPSLHAGSGKLLLTGGVSSIDGAAGGGCELRWRRRRGGRRWPCAVGVGAPARRRAASASASASSSASASASVSAARAAGGRAGGLRTWGSRRGGAPGRRRCSSSRGPLGGPLRRIFSVQAREELELVLRHYPGREVEEGRNLDLAGGDGRGAHSCGSLGSPALSGGTNLIVGAVGMAAEEALGVLVRKERVQVEEV